MAKNNRDLFTIPADQRKEFNTLVKRANRRILANMKYIQQEDIKDSATRRSLVGRFDDPTEWSGVKNPFSRSVRFTSRTLLNEKGEEVQISAENAFKLYKRKLERYAYDINDDRKKKIAEFGFSDNNIIVADKRLGFYENIIKSLTTVAINVGALDEKGRLPAEIAKKVKELSLEQMIHYFEEGDPGEEFDYLPYSGEDYEGADQQDFIDITLGRLDKLQRIYKTKEYSNLLELYKNTKHRNDSFREIKKYHNKREAQKRYRAKKKKQTRKKK